MCHRSHFVSSSFLGSHNLSSSLPRARARARTCVCVCVCGGEGGRGAGVCLSLCVCMCLRPRERLKGLGVYLSVWVGGTHQLFVSPESEQGTYEEKGPSFSSLVQSGCWSPSEDITGRGGSSGGPGRSFCISEETSGASSTTAALLGKCAGPQDA
jgi:hypothetical protein